MLEAVKQDWRALEHATAALKSEFEVVLEAVSRHRDALSFAAYSLFTGGFKTHLSHLATHVYNVPRSVFMATILFGAKAPTSGANNHACVLSLICPSNRVPASFSLQIKRLIWNFAGVRSGEKWELIEMSMKNIADGDVQALIE